VIVGIFPLDHVAWTSALEGKGKVISEDIKKVAGVKGKELWIGGTVDPVARGALEAKGWKVEEKVDKLRRSSGQMEPCGQAPVFRTEVERFTGDARGRSSIESG
jgi:hypothetical protein